MPKAKPKAKKKYSTEFIQTQQNRAIDDQYTHLELAKIPYSIKLPCDYLDEVKSRGAGWLRNLICSEIDRIRKVTNDTM